MKKERFEVKASLGYDPITGKQIRKSVYSPISRADALEKAQKMEAEYQKLPETIVTMPDKYDVQGDLTFANFAVNAVIKAKLNAVKGKTLQCNYIYPLQSRIIPFFEKNIREICFDDLQDYVNQKGKPDKDNVVFSRETLMKDLTVIKLVIKLAHKVDNTIALPNWIEPIVMPKEAPATPTMRVYDTKEYEAVTEFACAHTHGLPILLALHGGLTLSEVFGIDFENVEIDEVNEIVRIRILQGWAQDYVIKNGKKTWVPQKSNLKNKYRERVIPIIDPRVIEKIKAVPRKVKVKTNGKVKIVEPKRLCYSAHGLPVNPNNWKSRYYKKFNAELKDVYPNIHPLKFHELRHTCITYWRKMGLRTDVVIKLAGWKDERMMSKYDHVYNKDTEDDIIEKLKNQTK